MNMRAPTHLEVQLMNEVVLLAPDVWQRPSANDEKKDKFLFKDKDGNIYMTSFPTPNSPSDISQGSFNFSQKELDIIENFEVQAPRKDDLFAEAYPPVQEFMSHYVSEMLKILIAEWADSPKFQKIIRDEPVVRNVQTTLKSWDPGKGKEVLVSVERRVYTTEKKVATILRDQ